MQAMQEMHTLRILLSRLAIMSSMSYGELDLCD